MAFRTIYRAIVMIATGVIVVEGWKLYGPPTEKVKSIAINAMEMAQTALNQSEPSAADPAAPAVDPRSAAPPLAATSPAAVVDAAPPDSETPELVPLPNAGGNDVLDGGASAAPSTAAATIDNLSAQSGAPADELAPLLSQLESIGGSDAQLAPWGTSGQLHRFSCRAKLVPTSAIARHFEAVASEPVAAVEQVLAEVEAWRATQREPVSLR
jgi:hypothetical protein